MFDDKTYLDQHNFADSILVLASQFNISVSSWGRSVKHNHDVGGVVDSQHLKWLAVDVVLDEDVDREALKTEIKALQLQLIIETDHWHIQQAR